MTQRESSRRGFLSSAAMGAAGLFASDRLSAAQVTSEAKPHPCEDSESLRVALLQMRSSIVNLEDSSPFKMLTLSADAVQQQQGRMLERADTFCRRAAALGADIALFPEMWNIGYAMFDAKQKGAKEAWLGLAVDDDSTYVRHFTALARELNMAIAVTYLQSGTPLHAIRFRSPRAREKLC